MRSRRGVEARGFLGRVVVRAWELRRGVEVRLRVRLALLGRLGWWRLVECWLLWLGWLRCCEKRWERLGMGAKMKDADAR